MQGGNASHLHALHARQRQTAARAQPGGPTANAKVHGMRTEGCTTRRCRFAPRPLPPSPRESTSRSSVHSTPAAGGREGGGSARGFAVVFCPVQNACGAQVAGLPSAHACCVCLTAKHPHAKQQPEANETVRNNEKPPTLPNLHVVFGLRRLWQLVTALGGQQPAALHSTAQQAGGMWGGATAARRSRAGSKMVKGEGRLAGRKAVSQLVSLMPGAS